jgi:hypothetical protein
LAKNAGPLRELGAYPWGRWLEDAFTPAAFEWQRVNGRKFIRDLGRDTVAREFEEALDRGLASLPNGTTAIWSNESIYPGFKRYAPILGRLCEREGLEIRPVVYVRNHRDFARSAYVQWGVKHKTYAGRVRGFADWAGMWSGRLAYGERLEQWDSAFGDRLQIFNYDAVGDVVNHFLGLLPPAAAALPRGDDLSPNRSPSPRMLALYALHNNLSDDPIFPRPLELLVERQPALQEGCSTAMLPLASLFPTATELDRVVEDLADDTARVNRLLERRGQPALVDRGRGADAAPDAASVASDLLSTLMHVTIEQDRILRERDRTLHEQELALRERDAIIARHEHRAAMPLWRRLFSRE